MYIYFPVFTQPHTNLPGRFSTQSNNQPATSHVHPSKPRIAKHTTYNFKPRFGRLHADKQTER